MKKLLILCLVPLLFVSCKKDHTIYFDESIPLSLVPDVKWGVIVDPYAAYREESFWDSNIQGHCRKGDIIQIMGKHINESGIWYKGTDGWLHESALDIYTNRFKAVKALSSLK